MFNTKVITLWPSKVAKGLSGRNNVDALKLLTDYAREMADSDGNVMVQIVKVGSNYTIRIARTYAKKINSRINTLSLKGEKNG